MDAILKLYLDKRRVKTDGTYPVCLNLLFKKKRSYVNLGYSVHTDFWSQEFGRITRGAKMKNISYANDDISERLENGLKIISRFKSLGTLDNMAHSDLKKLIESNSTAIVSFSAYLDQIIEGFKCAGNTGQAKIYSGTKRFIENYGNKQGEYLFDDINYSFLIYVETKFKPMFEGNKNGLSIYLRTIRAVWNRAIKEHVANPDKYPFKSYSIKNSKTHKTAISAEDMRKIADLDLLKGSKSWHSRNLFFFSFYTRGMNFIDIASLKVGNIENGRITYLRRKVKKPQSIKITENIQKILNQYIDEKSQGYVFPVIENLNEIDKQVEKYHSEANHALKRWAKRLNLNPSLSFNTARHSWATIGKNMHLPIAVISQGLGHSDIKTTQIYLDDFDQSVIDDANDLVVF